MDENSTLVNNLAYLLDVGSGIDRFARCSEVFGNDIEGVLQA